MLVVRRAAVVFVWPRETTAARRDRSAFARRLDARRAKGTSEKAYVARSVDDLCAFLAGPEAVNTMLRKP